VFLTTKTNCVMEPQNVTLFEDRAFAEVVRVGHIQCHRCPYGTCGVP
jgi:hypothetical protein